MSEDLQLLIYNRIVDLGEVDSLDDGEIRAIAGEAAATISVPATLQALIPEGRAKVDGQIVRVVRIPNVKLSDQWGNPYEGLVMLPGLP